MCSVKVNGGRDWDVMRGKMMNIPFRVVGTMLKCNRPMYLGL